MICRQLASLWPAAGPETTVGTFLMDMLPAIPLLLLGVVVSWLIWPVVVDPIVRAIRRVGTAENDNLADHLFECWSDRARPAAANRG